MVVLQKAYLLPNTIEDVQTALYCILKKELLNNIQAQDEFSGREYTDGMDKLKRHL